MKKILPIIIVVVVVVAAALYFFVFSGGEKPIVYSYASTGDHFVINVKGTNSLFKTGVTLKLTEEMPDDEQKEKQSLIRETIIFILRDQTLEDLTAPGVRENLKALLVSALNEALEIESVADVQFYDFVIQ